MLIPIGANKKPLAAWRSAGSSRGDKATLPRWLRAKAVMWARVIPACEVVLDLDDGRAPPSDWPATAELWTPRGVHVWFRATPRCPRMTKRSGVVIDGRKSMCVRPGPWKSWWGSGKGAGRAKPKAPTIGDQWDQFE